MENCQTSDNWGWLLSAMQTNGHTDFKNVIRNVRQGLKKKQKRMLSVIIFVGIKGREEDKHE